ncbi:hypothetical protein Syun_007731 [Stephania yunnanensis]|uniref:Uncharacterized protein n=1 Tax=Stephania yunnanensis TaxID=152371 RepID=A0AAP0L027_9MAGN
MVRYEKKLMFYIKYNLVGAAVSGDGSGSGGGGSGERMAAAGSGSGGQARAGTTAGGSGNGGWRVAGAGAAFGKGGKLQGRGLRGGWGRDGKRGGEGGQTSTKCSGQCIVGDYLNELNMRIQSQEIEIEKLRLEHIKLVEENDGLHLEKQKLAEEASYAKVHAAALEGIKRGHSSARVFDHPSDCVIPCLGLLWMVVDCCGIVVEYGLLIASLDS